MESKILAAYATTHGSTREIAEFVAETLRGLEQTVDLQPARQVRSLDGYSAVVLGAPLYILHLHKDALRFLTRHQAALTRIPTAVFAGGPYGDVTTEVWQEVRKELDQDLAKLPWFNPVSIQITGGRFDPAHLSFPWSLIPAIRSTPPSDLRDWEAIRAWAAGLPKVFQLTSEASKA